MNREKSYREIELLAPARTSESGKLAIEYGADAVYIGGPKFGARQSAGNSVDEIVELVEYAHAFGAKVYVALNTVVFEHELKEAEEIARSVVDAGVDALIIQDMAYMRMGLEGVEFHASTQMCNTSAERIKFLQGAGFSRVILERGLSLKQIEHIRAETEIELECFVHGAICVGFSGQCYLSRSQGPRSGNRGECSQSCRQTYDLINEEGEVIIERKHLLSVLDMNLTERIPQMIDAGIVSFKIEGRLKEDDYVKNVVAHYRKTIDRAIAEREGLRKSSTGRIEYDFTPNPDKSFTRGGSLWMIDGQRRGVASFDTPKAVGEQLGSVTKCRRGSFELDGEHELSAGDGICFFVEGELKGTNINRVEGNRIYPNRIEGIEDGIELYRNFDHKFANQLNMSRTKRVIDVEAVVKLSMKEGVDLTLTDSDGVTVELPLTAELTKANNPSSVAETIRTQVAKSGDTIFNIKDVVLLSSGEMPFVPISVINGLRREATDRLLEKRIELAKTKSNLNKGNNLPPKDSPAKGEGVLPYPTKELSSKANVVNSLARQFYHDHGVEQIDEGLDLKERYSGECVMRSAYCIRKEIGECLLEEPKYRGKLYLQRGTIKYRLDFDCRACQMSLTKE